MSVEWLKKQKRIQKRSKEPEEKQKSSTTKIPVGDYLKKHVTPEEEKIKLYQKFQEHLEDLGNYEGLEKERKLKVQQEMKKEIDAIIEAEKNEKAELRTILKQTLQNDLETSQLAKEQARLIVENERLLNIQYKQNFKNYLKHMKKAGVTVNVDADYIKKVLKKDA